MASKKENRVYAHISASYNHGYGHINIHVYELFGYNGGTLKISCQSGGSSASEGQTYAWEHGVSNDYSVIGLNTLKQGYWLMRRISNQLKKFNEDQGYPETFAEYSLRVLRAAGIRRAHVMRGVNMRGQEVKTLPMFDPLKQGDLLLAEIQNLEQSIITLG